MGNFTYTTSAIACEAWETGTEITTNSVATSSMVITLIISSVTLIQICVLSVESIDLYAGMTSINGVSA